MPAHSLLLNGQDPFSVFGFSYAWEGLDTLYMPAPEGPEALEITLSGAGWHLTRLSFGIRGAEAPLTLTLSDQALDPTSGTRIDMLRLPDHSDADVTLENLRVRSIDGNGNEVRLTLGGQSVDRIRMENAQTWLTLGAGFVMNISLDSGTNTVQLGDGSIGAMFFGRGTTNTVLPGSGSGSFELIWTLGDRNDFTFNSDGAAIVLSEGVNTVTFQRGFYGSVMSWRGANTIDVQADADVGSINLSSGVDSLTVAGWAGQVMLGEDGDTVALLSGGWIDSLNLGSGNNIATIEGEALSLIAHDGADAVTMRGTAWVNQMQLGGGANHLVMAGTAWLGQLRAFEGDDLLELSGDSRVEQAILSEGANSVTLRDTAQIRDLRMAHGADTVVLRDDTRVRTLSMGDGDDVLIVHSGRVNVIMAEDGNNTIVTGNRWTNLVSAYDGDDHVTIGSGKVGSVTLDNGDNTVDLRGGRADLVVTGDGADTVRLGALGAGRILTGAGDDHISVSPFVPDWGVQIVAGDGRDMLDLSAFGQGVRIVLSEAGTWQNVSETSDNAPPGQGYVSVHGIEDVTGSAGADSLTGSSAANMLVGRAGADILDGAGGADLLLGGAGADLLRGGGGHDTLAGDEMQDGYRLTVSRTIAFGGEYDLPAAAGDVTGDGLVDIVTQGRLSVLRQIANGNFTPAVVSHPWGYQQTADLGDVDGDGDLDLVTQDNVGWPGLVHIFANDGAGGFSHAATIGNPAAGRAILGDVNGDGRQDVIVPDHSADTLRIYLSGVDPAVVAAPVEVSTAGAEGVTRVADWDGDGRIDIILANPQTGAARLVRMTADGAMAEDLPGFGAGTGSWDGQANVALSVVELTGDSRADVAIGRSDGTVDVMENRSDGSLALLARLRPSDGRPVVEVKVADLNGDGLQDVVALSGDPIDGSTTLSVFLGQQGGGFGAEVVLDQRSNGGGFVLADVMGDGVLDVLRGVWGAGTAVVLTGAVQRVIGADTMLGGAGNDTYLVNSAADRVFETVDPASTVDAGGIDTVQSSITFSLDLSPGVRFVENLVLTGTGNINGTGNALTNRLTGNAGNNLLDGGTGADKMAGGAGNDTYVVDMAGDRVVEEVQGGGTDTVLSAVSYSLNATEGARGVENMTLTGAGNVSATGNALANRLVGNSGNNTLDGGAGADTLTGGGGSDSFVFSTAPGTGPGTGHVDRITDFLPVDDTIRLDDAAFAGLARGALAAAAFAANAAGRALDVDDRIIYETDTGRLLYDVDGTGNIGAVLFAVLAPELPVTHADFIVF